MGYTTEFEGEFSLDKPLSPEHKQYLIDFSQTRRMCRDPSVARNYLDPVRAAAKLPIGKDAGFFVGSTENWGQNHTGDVVNYNKPPRGQPNLWCKWAPSEDGKSIQWDGAEKFYNYTAWLKYLIKYFLEPWGYKLNGCVRYSGEDVSDCGEIIVEDNVVEKYPFHHDYDYDED